MESLAPLLDLERFFSRLATARRRVLLLDYDGTLAPFHVDPRLAAPYPQACALLDDIVAAPDSRVVVVSGRSFETLEGLLAMVPHTEAWASHGWERFVGGRLTHRIPSSVARQELEYARACAQRFASLGARVESKVASVALHWRGLDPLRIRRIRATFMDEWLALPHDELQLLPFDGGLEIRARGFDKGSAVREALAMHAVHTVCAYLGDDLTDEDAFRAIRGRGLPVLVRDEKRQTRAELWLAGPEAMLRFLERWREAVAPPRRLTRTS